MPNTMQDATEMLPTVRELRAQLRQCMVRHRTLTKLLTVAESAALIDCDSPEEIVAAAVSALRSDGTDGKQLASRLLARLREQFGLSLVIGSEVSQ